MPPQTDVVPVRVKGIDPNTGLITSADEVPPNAGSDGAAYVFDPRVFAVQQVPGGGVGILPLAGRRALVRINGDQIFDSAGNALDLNLLQPRLPTGDRVPGGVFESRFQFR